MAINYELIYKGAISLGGGNFEPLSAQPLDSRTVVPTLAGLQNYIDNGASYEGMIVYDEETKKTYQVQTIDGVLSYREFGLTQAELKDLIASETTAAMEFKGATATLPENPAKGDMWKVTASFEVAGETAKVGDSIVYSGEEWFLIPSGDDIEDTWRPVTGVNNDASLTFAAGDVLDVAVAANGTVTYSHEAIAAPELIAENEQTRTYITAVETDGHGHITGYKTAEETVTDSDTKYTFEGQVESSNVSFNVTPDTEGAATQTVYMNAYSKNETYNKDEVNTALGDKLDKSVYEAYIAGKEMSDADLKEYADDQDAALKAELLGGEGDTFGTKTIEGTRLYASYMANQAEISAKDYADGINTQIAQNLEGNFLKKADAASTYAKITDLHSHDNKNELDQIVTGSVTKWNEAYAHSQAAHAPANAQANIIESVKVNGTALGITNKAVDISVPTGALADKDKVAKADLAEALATEIDSKVASVTAGDVSITVGGTATAPTVAVNLSAAEGNALTLAEDGLKVIIPESTKVEESETNGNIKVDGQEVTVYSHPDKHTVSEISDFETEIASYNYATKTEAQGYANAKDSAIATAKQAGDDAQAHSEGVADDLAEYEESNDARVKAIEDEIGFTPTEAVSTLKNYIDLQDGATLQEAKDYVDSELGGYTKSIAAGDASITIDGSNPLIPTIAVKLDTSADNALKLNENGLKVEIGAAPEYSIKKAENSGDYAAIYNITKDGVIVGDSINIPKDMVVSSGEVVDVDGVANIKLVLANATNDEIFIPVDSLIEYVTSGSATGDMVVINVSDDHKVTATITDGTITLAKLATDIQTAIGKAHSHDNASVLGGITANKVADWDDAVSKEHTHSFVESELNKIADGDVAKWNAAEQNAKDYADEEIDKIVGTSSDTSVNLTLNGLQKYIGTKIDGVAAGDGIAVNDADSNKNKPVISLNEATKTSLGKADSALQSIGHGPNGYGKDELVISEKTANIQTIELSAKTRASLAKADSALQEHQDISGKADKVSGATAGNFAGLDANGNLTDSGKKAADFVQSVIGQPDTTGKGIGGIAASGNVSGNVIVGLDTTAQANLELAKNSVQGATDGLKVNENKQVVFDDAVTFIFDCGGAEV